jgi:TatD DNase family protein
MSDHPAVPLDRQRRLLSAQLVLASALDLPVILHARGPGAYSLLSEHLKNEQSTFRGVLHSYGGGAEMLKPFLRWPLCFGFAGPATYRNAPKVAAAIAAVPEERLLAETDAPDQTPEPHRPGRSEPAYVVEVIAGIAAARGASPEQVAQVTTENARRLFRL